MLVFGTQIELITFVFIVLECCMFIFQGAFYLLRPQDESRLWYLLLLFLLLFYNITGGLFPDPKIHIPLPVQEMIAYGSGFLMASYFPFYFYKAFNLNALRWHALFGVPLFLMLPYLVFFVVVYAINGKLTVDIRIGMIIPFAYALVLLWFISKAIRKKHQGTGKSSAFWEEMAMYGAVTPWAALAFFGMVEESQVTEVLCTNTGIIIITILFIWKSVKKARWEYEQLLQLKRQGFRTAVFEKNCRHYRLTQREIEIVLLVQQGLTYKEVSGRLFISGKTVDNHLQHVYEKAGVNNKVELIRKLYY
ncbi:MAG: hypothetical protein JWR12_2971 [Mucilaginibacter sp.]|nr:hypothetical protein [Mucilaginibacter sp.]